MTKDNKINELHFLYCFDNNFNKQALTSIKSLLDVSTEKVNIHIIHQNAQECNSLVKKLEGEINLAGINIYQFDKNKIVLPAVKSHVSEATYYRLFITDFLPKDLKYITYLDADIICVNDPVQAIRETNHELLMDNKILAALTDTKRERSNKLFNRLNLKGNNYFNAGVLIIDFEKWLSTNVQDGLFKIIEKNFNEINDYDQEILNIYFDDNFIEINPYLNFQAIGGQPELIKLIKKEAFFLHYLGKNKPWTVIGIIDPISKFYQEAFRKLKYQEYHLTFERKPQILKKFLRIVVSLKFLEFEKPGYYLIVSLKRFFVG